MDTRKRVAACLIVSALMVGILNFNYESVSFISFNRKSAMFLHKAASRVLILSSATSPSSVPAGTRWNIPARAAIAQFQRCTTTTSHWGPVTQNPALTRHRLTASAFVEPRWRKLPMGGSRIYGAHKHYFLQDFDRRLPLVRQAHDFHADGGADGMAGPRRVGLCILRLGQPSFHQVQLSASRRILELG